MPATWSCYCSRKKAPMRRWTGVLGLWQPNQLRYKAVRGHKYLGFSGRVHQAMLETPLENQSPSTNPGAMKIRVSTESGAPIVAPDTATSFQAVDALLPPSLQTAFPLYRKFQRMAVPTPVQQACFPLALRGKDVCCVAATGSGKTISYIVAALSNVIRGRGLDDEGSGAGRAGSKACPDCGLDNTTASFCSATGSPHPPLSIVSETAAKRLQRLQDEAVEITPRAVVVVPTVLLALRVEEIIRKVNCGVRACVLVRYSREQQWVALEEEARHCDIVVSTPGALLNTLGSAGKMSLRRCSTFVMDEVDALLGRDLFQVTTPILKRLRRDARKAQVLAFSATLPAVLYNIAKTHALNKAHRLITANVAEDGHSKEVGACATHFGKVAYVIHLVERKSKMEKLSSLVDAGEIPAQQRLLIFCGSKATIAWLSNEIARRFNKNVFVLTGDLPPAENAKMLRAFLSGPSHWCLATDVGARGIDFDDVWVLNYDMPSDLAMFVHRAGRTGRHGRSGTVISFFIAEESRLARPLCDLLRQHAQPVPARLAEYARQHYMAHFVANTKYVAKHNMDESKSRFGSSLGSGVTKFPVQ